MAFTEPERYVQPSVLDRLIDNEPGSNVEAQPTRLQSVRDMKAAVRRDLEWLLNTRRCIQSPPEDCEQLKNSVYTYGLPDLTIFPLNSPADEKRLLRILESTLSLFEPRLRNVRVSTIEPLKGQKQTLHFQIDGLLMIDPAPEHISFDTVLQIAKGEYLVKSDSDAG